MGADAPADHVIATIVAALGAAAVPMVLPLGHQFSRRRVTRVVLGLWLASNVLVALGTLPYWNGYDRMHPKRIYALCTTNVTTPEPTMSLNIAAADKEQGFAQLVRTALEQLDVPIPDQFSPTKVIATVPDMDVLHPLGQLLQTLRIPLPSTSSALATQWHETFRVNALSSSFSAGIRRVTLEIVHPGIIWSVIAFDADIISWSLSDPAPTGPQRHHIKQVSGYGVDRWQVQLVIRTNEPGLRVDYSGLDERGLHPHTVVETADESSTRPAFNFMRRLDAVLPDHVNLPCRAAMQPL